MKRIELPKVRLCASILVRLREETCKHLLRKWDFLEQEMSSFFFVRFLSMWTNVSTDANQPSFARHSNWQCENVNENGLEKWWCILDAMWFAWRSPSQTKHQNAKLNRTKRNVARQATSCRTAIQLRNILCVWNVAECTILTARKTKSLEMC